MTERRLIEIESRLGHQDQLLADLDAVITKQQESIMRLEELYRSMVQRIRVMADALPSDSQVHEQPPHY